MPVNIHGKDYFTVAERVLQLHGDLKSEDPLEISTKIIQGLSVYSRSLAMPLAPLLSTAGVGCPARHKR